MNKYVSFFHSVAVVLGFSILMAVVFFKLGLIKMSLMALIGMVYLFFKEEEKEVKKVERLRQIHTNAKEKCTVRLISVGHEKIKVIRIMREFNNWDLTTAKEKN